MKTLATVLILTIACLALSNAQTAFQQENVEMAIAGTSTVHAWESSVNEVQVEGKFIINDHNVLTGIEALKVMIPVKSIQSKRGKTMDKKTWDALKFEAHPNIQYKLNKVKSINTTADGLLLDLTGIVSIAGVEQAIDLVVTGKWLTDGKMEFKGEKKLNMVDFEIIPPTALFGTLKTGEEITIKFTVTMGTEKS